MAKWGKADFRELKRLQEKMQRLQKADRDKFCRDCAKELAARLLALVIKRTPVGRKPKLDGPKTESVTGVNGKKRTFLTREGAIQEKYWSGYMGGTLRRGWTAKTEEEAENGSGVGNDPVEFAQSLTITKRGDSYQIEIINPVHYASYVEYGHRQTPGRYVPALGKKLKKAWVKGEFMLTISEQELQTVAPGLLEKKLYKYLGECFNDK